MSKKKEILILGAAGFIGINLCKFYLKKNYKVMGVDNFYLGKKKNIDELIKEYKKQFCFKKINLIFSKNLKKIPKKKFFQIINLVANSDISRSSSDSFLDINLNLITTVNILDYFKTYKKTKFFFSSTSAIYGKNAINVHEKTTKLNPVSLYGSTKLACEKFIGSFFEYHKLNHVIFRFPNVIGPHLTHGIIFDFLKKLNKTNFKTLKILGNGSQRKNYIYIDDLCEAIYLAMKKKIRRIETYNVMTNGSTSVKEIVNILKKKTKKNFKTLYGKNNVGWVGDVNKYSYKTNKIKQIGWKPKIKNSTEAVKKTIDLYIK
jgi:UDP-glucose 4-epimerase